MEVLVCSNPVHASTAFAGMRGIVVLPLCNVPGTHVVFSQFRIFIGRIILKFIKHLFNGEPGSIRHCVVFNKRIRVMFGTANNTKVGQDLIDVFLGKFPIRNCGLQDILLSLILCHEQTVLHGDLCSHVRLQKETGGEGKPRTESLALGKC